MEQVHVNRESRKVHREPPTPNPSVVKTNDPSSLNNGRPYSDFGQAAHWPCRDSFCPLYL